MGKMFHSLRFQLPVVVLGVFLGTLSLLILFFHEMRIILVKTGQLAQSAEINDGVSSWITAISSSARERTKLMSLGKESYLRSFQVTLGETNELYGSLQAQGSDTLAKSYRELGALHEKQLEYADLLDNFSRDQAARKLSRQQAELAAKDAEASRIAAAKRSKTRNRRAPAKLARAGRTGRRRGAERKGSVAGAQPEAAKEIVLDTATNETFKAYEQDLREGLYLVQETLRAERKDKLQSLRNAVGRAKDRLVYSLVLLLVMVGYVAFILKWKFLDPMKGLKQGVLEIGKGSLGYQVQIHSRNEMGELAQVFNRMSIQLQEKQRSEVRLKRLEAIEQIVRSVNHEINNPLMIISGNAEYLQAILEDGGDDVKKKLDVIIAEVRRIFTVTQRLKEIKEPITQNYIGDQDKMIDLLRSSQIRPRDF